MITNYIKNAAQYFGLHDRLAASLRYLQKTDLTKLEPGRHELDGSNLFVHISAYETKPKEKGRWEAHKRYLDIQYLIEGAEQIGYASLENVKLGAYDEAKDFQEIVQAQGDFLTLRPGMFMILAPQDAHMPGLALTNPQPVKKAVVKVRVSRNFSSVNLYNLLCRQLFLYNSQTITLKNFLLTIKTINDLVLFRQSQEFRIDGDNYGAQRHKYGPQGGA